MAGQYKAGEKSQKLYKSSSNSQSASWQTSNKFMLVIPVKFFTLFVHVHSVGLDSNCLVINLVCPI